MTKFFTKLAKNYHIKTHDSELRGQEETGCTQQTSELFICSTTLKFTEICKRSKYVSQNESYHLVNQGLSTF